MKFRSDENLQNAVRLTVNALLTDSDLPVRVEAAMALQNFLNDQEKVEAMLVDQVEPITLELLRIIRETENDELSNVLQKVVFTYPQQIAPIALQICQHLVFEKDGFDYFTDMMPALHNYVTIDTPAFLSNPNNVLAMFNMCKVVRRKNCKKTNPMVKTNLTEKKKDGEDDDDDDDDDDDYGGVDDGSLEAYTTPLDDEICEIDEYVVFKQVLQEPANRST
ncbi:unnamed protein product [Nesidiocoris tenuis]|uniref:Condensin complex subunit 1 C-terminal domain-containing protein n=1 Tax=Nesidiocoris tenuis TaxID=355587 RepID=A0A6H5H4U2_9HEMI|nr:unnamed protein product [Nesidiocoris tenuis]